MTDLSSPQTYEQILKLQAPKDRMLHLWFEPWADGLAFPAGTEVELHAISSVEGQLEFDITPERTAVYGWAGSILRVLVKGKVVISFDQPVPNFLSKDMITLFFGSPPTPTEKEGGTPPKKTE
jgi:hypothetical protein